jgi:lipase maturation factor 1
MLPSSHHRACYNAAAMEWTPRNALRWLLDSDFGPRDRFLPRWIVLRLLGLIYFSAFYSLVFQIKGEIAPDGIFPAQDYLQRVAHAFSGLSRFWYAPTLGWISTGPHMLMAWCWIGMIAAAAATLNLWPRMTLFICFVCFLSFIACSGEFGNYQSDGMLLEAGFIALFFAPAGFRPGWGINSPPSRASYFLLQWEWFRIYFESGIGKILSGDPEWRHLTAMDQYYQNGPLPTWIGWYAQQRLPHGFHVATAALTLALEIGIIWIAWLPRKWHTREVLFFIVTPWEIGIILTANYTFLNYLVLTLGFLLLTDGFVLRFVPAEWKTKPAFASLPAATSPPSAKIEPNYEQIASPTPGKSTWQQFRPHLKALTLAITAVLLGLIALDTTLELVAMLEPGFPTGASILGKAVEFLEPFRIANQYGLFESMTTARYEIEFQGSDDEKTWITYPFKYKPQALNKAPGIYAPYQPRFDWNLWFASLSNWREDPLALRTEECLLQGGKDVIALFAGNPFPNHPPKAVRAILWDYTFTTPAEKRATGDWWNRKFLGLYCPAIERDPATGKFVLLDLGPPNSIQP